MASSQDGNIGLYSGYTPGDNGWTSQHNANWDVLDALVEPVIKSAALATPPGSPGNGDAYIVAASPTGAWSGEATKIAVYLSRSSSWAFITPKAGWGVRNLSDSSVYVFDGTSWSANEIVAGNVILSGVGARILADFSTATLANRAMLQTSTANGNTVVGILPNGSSTSASLLVFNKSDPANSSFFLFNCAGSVAQMVMGQTGSGTNLPFSIVVAGSEAVRIETTNRHITPGADNSQNFGSASLRLATIYAGTGTINTSDEREKQQIQAMSDAEKRVAIACKGLVRKFKFNNAVSAKGDAARWHFGVVAQEVSAAFSAEGLDARNYSLFCYDEWDAEAPVEEVRDEDGNIVVVGSPGRPAGNRYGVRYDELAMFILGAL